MDIRYQPQRRRPPSYEVDQCGRGSEWTQIGGGTWFWPDYFDDLGDYFNDGIHIHNDEDDVIDDLNGHSPVKEELRVGKNISITDLQHGGRPDMPILVVF